MWLGANKAFCLLLLGWLGIYCELIWPGRVLAGIVGAAALVTGGYRLWQAGPSPHGLQLLAAATVLFLLDSFAETFFLAGAAGTLALALGFSGLFSHPNGIQPGLAVGGSLALGGLTTGLNWVVRRARRNKRADFPC